MVETDRQYEFIYEAILEVLVKHDMNTEMTKRNAKELHRSLIMVDHLTGCSGFGKIFKVLHRGLKTESSIIKHFEGSKAINDYKNRYITLLSVQMFHILLINKDKHSLVNWDRRYFHSNINQPTDYLTSKLSPNYCSVDPMVMMFAQICILLLIFFI